MLQLKIQLITNAFNNWSVYVVSAKNTVTIGNIYLVKVSDD